MNSRLRELVRLGVDPRLLHWACCPQKKGGSAPPPPDYAGAAAQQGQASKEVTNMQTYANRPDQTTPWGKTTWGTEDFTDPATGQQVTKWSQNQTLDPKLQGALDEQLNLQGQRSGLAGDFMSRVESDYDQPFDWDKMPAAGNAPVADAAERQRIEQGLFDRMRPEHQFQEEAARTRLANQGFTAGSEGYNRELERVGDQQSRERYDAMMRGGEEQQRLFGMQMQGSEFQSKQRQQAIAEEAQRRGMSLNEMNALLTGQQVQAPNMPSFSNAGAAQPTQYLPAAMATGNYNLQNQQMENQSNAGLWGGLGSLAGSGAMLYAMSDMRLKSNVTRVGRHPIGVNVYEYDIMGRRECGVMAQELLEVAPWLVAKHPSGYLMVNYGGL